MLYLLSKVYLLFDSLHHKHPFMTESDGKNTDVYATQAKQSQANDYMDEENTAVSYLLAMIYERIYQA